MVTSEVSEPSIVGPPNNEVCLNVERLRDIDQSVDAYLSGIVKIEQSDASKSADIIAAGIQMLAIRENDPEAWDLFKKADPKAKDITTKGRDREYREVAAVLWRKFKAEPATRERVSRYGKALKKGLTLYREHIERPAELAEHVRNLGGVKGLLTVKVPLDGTEHGESEPKKRKVYVTLPDEPTLFLIGPDRTVEALEPELNRTLLLQINRLH